MAENLLVIVILVVLVIAAGLGPLRRAWSGRRMRSSSIWQLYPATVQMATVETSAMHSGTTYRVKINYSYQVSGEFYSGSYTGESLSSETEAEEFATRFAAGATVQAKVQAGRPEKSMLVL